MKLELWQYHHLSECLPSKEWAASLVHTLRSGAGSSTLSDHYWMIHALHLIDYLSSYALHSLYLT